MLAIPQTWPAAVVAAIVLGCAYGIYTAVDFALITQVLPDAVDRAKDLGVINIANALPQVFAPALAGILLTVVRELGGSVTTRGDGWSLGYGPSTPSPRSPRSSAPSWSPGSAPSPSRRFGIVRLKYAPIDGREIGATCGELSDLRRLLGGRRWSGGPGR